MWISYAGRSYRYYYQIGSANGNKMLSIFWPSLSDAIELFVLQLLCITGCRSLALTVWELSIWSNIKKKNMFNKGSLQIIFVRSNGLRCPGTFCLSSLENLLVPE